ncbi:hypothetical protein CHS0354_011121 [Potamilus streckersoni]|uniref:Uncharacterized protein n=2 Tax=Potamilus streckersoni TaxID=2493646 RepID=A0AAE0VLY9_9BIVA|nr:hypothetical protein CHS0354_011121 [Potamilus streckersoni]
MYLFCKSENTPPYPTPHKTTTKQCRLIENMEDSIQGHMEETIKQRRHHTRPVNVSHSECKAGMLETEWQRYHVIEKDKAEKYNVSETLSDERQHNVPKRGKSDEQDSLYVVMTSCEQAIQSSVHGKLASSTYSTGHANDNVAQRRMQENSDKEGRHQLKGKMEYEENYMPYLTMPLQEEEVDRDSKVEQNSYSTGRINVPFLSLHEDGRKGTP